MNVLGFSRGHDAGVSLIKDGKIIFNCQEERLTKIKHCNSLAVQALELCLLSTNTSIKDIDYIAIPMINRMPDIELYFSTSNTEVAGVNYKINDPLEIIRKHILRNIGILNVNMFNKLGFPLYQKRYAANKETKVIQVDHHTSHAASAYYCSGFDECLIATSDGVGGGLSLTVWLGKDGKLIPLTKIWRNGSLGFFYEIVTEGLGWQVGDGEGKTMGLAPYGNTKKTKGALDFIAPVFKDGKLQKSIQVGMIKRWDVNGMVHFHYDQSTQVKELADKYGRENIAAEAQRVLEEQMFNFLIPWIKKTGMKKLTTAGGTFLNVKLNQRIWETGLLNDYYPHCDPGDSGIPLGAALYTYYSYLNMSYKPKRISNTYWGPEYSDGFIKKELDTRNLKYTEFKDGIKLIENVAKLLGDGKIVGWFQGKMESGPRALGNRSILMDPRKAENKDIINSRVKYREAFRPFCPTILDTAAKDYLVNSTKADFMTISFDVPEKMKKNIPAVIHVDGTTRPQVLTKQANLLYYELIKEFERLTGIPALLNTSFNVKGQPIVCTPSDAIKCFYDTGLDYLAIGNFLLQK